MVIFSVKGISAVSRISKMGRTDRYSWHKTVKKTWMFHSRTRVGVERGRGRVCNPRSILFFPQHPYNIKRKKKKKKRRKRLAQREKERERERPDKPESNHPSWINGAPPGSPLPASLDPGVDAGCGGGGGGGGGDILSPTFMYGCGGYPPPAGSMPGIIWA